MKRFTTLVFAGMSLLMAASAAAQELRPLEEMVQDPSVAKDLDQLSVRCASLFGVLSERTEASNARDFVTASSKEFFASAAKSRLKKAGVNEAEGVNPEKKLAVINTLFSEIMDISEQYSKRIPAQPVPFPVPLAQIFDGDPLIRGDAGVCTVISLRLSKQEGQGLP